MFDQSAAGTDDDRISIERTKIKKALIRVFLITVFLIAPKLVKNNHRGNRATESTYFFSGPNGLGLHSVSTVYIPPEIFHCPSTFIMSKESMPQWLNFPSIQKS